MRSGEEAFGAEARLLELAKSHKLLDDPAATQNLISAALSVSSDSLDNLLRTIFVFAGAEQGYDFQLLFNHTHSTIQLKHARGERSWTHQRKAESS